VVREQNRDALLVMFLGPVQVYLEFATLDRRPRASSERDEIVELLAEGFARAVAPAGPQEAR
jgi:hypothetical protein